MVAAAAARPSSPAGAGRSVWRARLGEDTPERAPAPARSRSRPRTRARVTARRQREAGGRRQGHHGVEPGEEERLVRRHHDGASRQPRFDRRGQALHGRRVECGGRLVEQQDRCRAQQRTRQATRWRSPELSVSPSWPRAVRSPRGRLARSSERPTASSTRRRSSSDAPGAPSLRFSASVALKRCGRCGSHEKWARHAAAVSSLLRRDPHAMVPASGSTKRRSAASTVDLRDSDGPVRAAASRAARAGRSW